MAPPSGTFAIFCFSMANFSWEGGVTPPPQMPMHPPRTYKKLHFNGESYQLFARSLCTYRQTGILLLYYKDSQWFDSFHLKTIFYIWCSLTTIFGVKLQHLKLTSDLTYLRPNHNETSKWYYYYLGKSWRCLGRSLWWWVHNEGGKCRL